jgi:hypothetical protein
LIGAATLIANTDSYQQNNYHDTTVLQNPTFISGSARKIKGLTTIVILPH